MESNWPFRHLGVVVRDIDKAVEYYQSLGATVSRPEFMLDSSTFLDYKVYQRTPDTVDKTRMRSVELGSLTIELLQPFEGNPIYVDFLNTRGEGVQHIGFAVDDLDEETAKLAKKGISVATMAKLPSGAAFAYFDTGKVGNMLTELHTAAARG